MKQGLLQKMQDGYSIYHPLLALGQMGIAGFNTYVSAYVNFDMGIPKTFTILVRQASVCVCFLLLTLYTSKLRPFKRRQAPWLFAAGISGVFMNMYLFVISQRQTSPFHVALW